MYLGMALLERLKTSEISGMCERGTDLILVVMNTGIWVE